MQQLGAIRAVHHVICDEMEAGRLPVSEELQTAIGALQE